MGLSIIMSRKWKVDGWTIEENPKDETLEDLFGEVLQAAKTNRCPICLTELIETFDTGGDEGLQCPKCGWACGISANWDKA